MKKVTDINKFRQEKTKPIAVDSFGRPIPQNQGERSIKKGGIEIIIKLKPERQKMLEFIYALSMPKM